VQWRVCGPGFKCCILSARPKVRHLSAGRHWLPFCREFPSLESLETRAKWAVSSASIDKIKQNNVFCRELATVGTDSTKDETRQSALQNYSREPVRREDEGCSPGERKARVRQPTAEVLDLAAKSNVVVSGLNRRGVIQAEEDEDVTSRAGGERRTRPGEPLPLSAWIRYRRESARAEGDAVKDLVDATGGLLFQNNNDLVAGFDRISTAPEFSYVLGFSPADLKTDGTFHPLKIRVNRKGVSIEARRGYYALSANATDEWSTAEALDTLFSRDEKTDIPVVVVSGYSKPKTGDTAKIQVTAKIDVTPLHFHKSDDRNRDSLRAIVAVFDADGTYVTGTAENLKLSLPDDLLASNDPSVTLHWDFEVKPGTYAIRLVYSAKSTPRSSPL